MRDSAVTDADQAEIYQGMPLVLPVPGFAQDDCIDSRGLVLPQKYHRSKFIVPPSLVSFWFYKFLFAER